MNRWIYFGFTLLVSACNQLPQAPLVTDANGQTVIQINSSGLTCYESTCLEITRGSVRAIGHKRARIPKGIDVSSGTVSLDEFKRMRQSAMLAGGPGSGNR